MLPSYPHFSLLQKAEIYDCINRAPSSLSQVGFGWLKLLEESGGRWGEQYWGGYSPAPSLMEAARLQLSVSLSDPTVPLKAANSLSQSVCLSHTHMVSGENSNPSALGTQDGNSLAVTFLTCFWKRRPTSQRNGWVGMDLWWVTCSAISCHTLLRGREGPQCSNWVLLRRTCTLEALGGDCTLGRKMTMQYDAMELLSWLQNRNGCGRDQETALNKSHVRACVLSAFSHVDSLRPYGPWPARLLCPWRFSRQESWSSLPFPPPGDLHDPGFPGDSWESKNGPILMFVFSLLFLEGCFLPCFIMLDCEFMFGWFKCM